MSDLSPSEAVRSFPRRHALTRRFTLGAPRSWSISSDGQTVLFLRSSSGTDAQNSLWAVSRGDREPRVLFDAAGEESGSVTEAELARRERAREQAGGVVTYAARSDCSAVVFVLGGELRRIDVASGAIETLPAGDEIFDPRLCPDGDGVAYVCGRSLRLSGGDGDALIPGTLEENEMVSWGSAEFVAAEEMGRSRGFWWERSGGRIAATRVDTSPVTEWWIASPEAPDRAPRSIRYPAAGTTNALVELWIIEPTIGPVTQVDWQRGEFEYLAGVSWGDRLLCTVQTRDQRVTAILEVDPDTGATTELQRAIDDVWTELFGHTPHQSEHGLLTIVDHDGGRHVAADGRSIIAGGFTMRQLLGADDHSIFATATTNAINSVLVRLQLDGATEVLSAHDAYVSGSYAGGTFCLAHATSFGPTTHEIRWNDGTTLSIDSHASEPGFDCSPGFHVVGDRSLNVALCLPSGHDGSPLPVLLDPYGGPHAQRVLRSRNSYATSQWFAEQGFAVVIIDGRGTPGRGPAFEREVWGDLASPVLEDQIDGLMALAGQRNELDLSRVGIRGWSFGGFLAALAVLRRPDVFHAAVAGAPVTDWRLYDTHYTERYLGHPDVVPAHYEQSGLIDEAPDLARPLMLIHGLADDNVVAAHTLTFSRALLAAGREHQVLPLSGVTHMTPQEQVAENLLHLQRDFLLRSLSA